MVEHAIANHMFFKTQFRKQLMNTDYNLTHLEYGLKNLLHIMNNNDDDISILKDALKTLIHKQNEYDGDKYRFDTVVMRAFHYLNMPDQAIEVQQTFVHSLNAKESTKWFFYLQFFEDDVLGQLFTKVTSYQILLDLLYENEKYNDVLRIYNNLMMYGRLHKNKYIDVIILATYYRLVCHILFGPLFFSFQ